MIDIAMTAALRPEIILRTLMSISTNIDYRPLRLVVDIAPVGAMNGENQHDILVLLEQFVKLNPGFTLEYRMLDVSLQGDAVRWTWKECQTPYALHWEDDWVLRRPVSLKKIIKFMENNPKFGMIYLDRYKKSVLDYPGYRSCFKSIDKVFYKRTKGKSLGGPPALLTRKYMDAVIPLMKENVCLDTISPKKAAQRFLTGWDLGVYIGEDRKGHLVEDIGKQWKIDNNITMRKKTDKGVQWIKKS